MNRRQSSLDRPGILSPPGPFLTPSPSPSIPIASPRLAPSPSISPFSQDVLLVTNNTITNTTQEQERKAATPGRRQSIHQLNSGSPNAGTVVFQPSPSQSPAAATTVIGVTGNEFNTTLVGSNNISLNKKGKRLSQSQQYSIGYGQQQTTTITTSGTSSSSSSYVVNSCPKGQTKKGYNNLINSSTNNNFIQNNQLQQQQHNFLPNHAQLINPNGSPLLADSPIASPSGQIKPPTPQPQILHQFPTVLNTAGNHQLLQFLQGPQLIAAANAAIHQQHQHQQQQQQQQQHQQRQLMSNTGTVQNTTQSNIKTSKGPQQILPKPQQQQSLDNNSKNVSKQHQHHHQQQQQQQQQVHQICQSPQPQIITQSSNQSGSGSNNSSPAGGGQIIQLPTGNLGSQPLLLNQMPVLVQQNTPQGVQLILRPPTPQLTAAPSLVIHNSRPQQLQQNHQQQPQLLRILNTNSGMQLATTPTFIVSSQANLIQQNLQHTLKANQAQTTGPITTLSGLQANPRSQQLAAAINNHIFGQNMAQLQNLQLNGNLAQIQMPNGLHGPIISQLPTQFQQSLAGFNQLAQNLNINQLNSANLQQQIAAAAAAAAANAAFQSPPPPQHQQQIPPHHHHQVSELQMPTGTAVGITSQNLQFSTTSTPNNGGNGNQQHISITSPAVTPQPQLLPSVTPEPRNPTPVLQNIVTTQQPTTTTVLVQPDNLMQMQQNLISQQQIHQQQQQIQQQQMLHQQQIKPQPPPPKARKPAKSRKKKVQPIPMTTTMIIPQQQQQQQHNSAIITTTITSPSTTTTTSSSPPMKSLTSTGKLDLANVMKLCGIMEDDDYMMDDEPMIVPSQQSQEELIKLNDVNLTSSSSPTTILNQQQQQQPQQQLNSNDFMITIPSQNNSDMPFTFTIPANNNNNQCDNKNSSISDIEMTINTNNNTTFGNSSSSNSINSNINSGVGQSNNNNSSDTTSKTQQQSNNNLIDAQQNFVIKIDQNDSGQPYTISIPSMPTSNDIQQSIQQQQQQQVCQIITSSQQQQQQQSQQILQSNQQLTNLQTQQSQSIQMPSRSKSLTSPTSFTNNTFNSVPMSVGNNNLNTTSNIITSSNNNTITTTNFQNQQQLQQPTITSRMTEIQNHLIGAAAANAATISQQQQQLNINSGAMMTQSSTNIKNNMINSGNSTQTTNVCPITTTATTTATVKPRRKQPIKRNGKKVADSIISTPVGNVPSQIGNIQISQIDATKITNQQMPISNVVENKIQIMPIIDSSNNNNKIGNSTVTTQQQQIQNQIVLQPNNQQQQITQQNFDKTQQILHQPQQQQQISTTSTQQQSTLTIPIQANAAQTPATTLISQLTGALSLAFSEDGGRLLLRHDPNNPQDSQSQLILQAVLSGALPNITIINEPLISDKTKTLINTTVGNNSTNFQQKNNNLNNCGSLSINNSTVTTTTKLNNNKNQSIQLNQQQQQFQIQSNNIQNNQFVGIVGPSGSIIHNNNNNQAIDNLSLLQKRPSLEIKKNEIAQQSQNVVLPPPPLQQQQFIQQNSNGNTTIVVNPNTPKLVTLPKIESNQQLFSLNTLNNQITHISPGQTTASLGPMERLLIVPAGINAQQLAQCMLQGQIHFDNINPVPQAITNQQQQQQQQFLPLSQQIPQQQPQVNRIQQQIVHPQQHQPIQPLHQPINHQQNISTTTTTKQVANVAPIIDTSKTTVGKLETQKRKPKPRKPKVDLTNKTGTGATTATLKPIQKLDLNTKPNTNPVQIVQPTTAKDHLNQQQQQRTVVSANQFVVNSSSSNNSTTNTTSLTVSSSTSSIHPFNSSQTLSTGGGTKLIGVTAPMQQVTQNHRNMITNNCNISSNINNNGNNNNNQCNNLNNSANINNNIMVNNNSVALNNTNSNLSVQQQSQNIIPPRSLTTTATSNSNLSNSTTNVIPPLVSVNSSPQTITRVQTIQLTPQQQQLLKTVQIQIQQLSGKLQNKSLLSTLNIPADFDPNNPMYNKPLPSLVNIQQMTDSEIHGALQRLFIEQQKILASGKVIPTIPAPGSHHNFVHSPMLQQQSTTSSPSPVQNHMHQHQQQQQLIVNNFPTATNQQQQQQTNTFSNIKQIPPTPTGLTTIKNEGQIIPSNIVQPNNHNSTIVPQPQLQQQQSGNTQRIHIYPLQHQIQNKSLTNLQSNSNQFQQQNQFQNQQQQLKKDNNITNSNKQLLPTQQQLTHQQQQLPIYGNHDDKSIILPTQINKINIPNSAINDTKLSTVATTTIATAINIKTENLPDLPDVKPILNNLPTTISAIPPVESTKPKIARHALFERQLDVDQQACVKPDYITPFQNKEEAVKRLIRYHCLYQQDEEFPSDEEIEFEKCAIEFQNKFQGLTNKFQNLIFKESMLPHRTSELCLINHLLVSDIQQELLDMRTEANNQNTISSATNCNAIIKQETELNMNNNNVKTIQQSDKNISQYNNTNNYQDNQRLSFNRTPVEYINSSDSSGNYNYNSLIKNEIKSEPYDLNFINKCDNNSIFTTTVSTAIINKISTSIVTSAATTSSEPLLSTSGIVKNITTNRLFNHIGVQQQQQQSSTIGATTIKNEKEILTIDFRNYQNNKINFQTINKHEKLTNYTIKKEMDNFDIESEITPSFIMKKIDNNILPQNVTNNNNQSTSLNISSSAHSISSSSEDNDFSIDFNFTGQNNNNNNNNQHSQQQQSSNCYDNSNKFPTTINDIVGNNNRPIQQSLESKLNQNNEPYDEWLCIQKELNLITEKKSNLLSEQNLNNQQNNNNNQINHHHNHDNSNKSVEKELSEIFESSPCSKDVDNQISELFTNTTPTDNVQTNHLTNGDINHSPIKHQSSSSSLHLSELINSELININHDSIANKSVETRLEAMFGESPVIEKSDTSDLVESRLEELFNDDDDDDDNNDNNNINRINCINDDNIDENDTTNSPITSNIHHFNTQQQQQQMILNKNINHKRSWSNHNNNDDGDGDTDVTNKRSCLLANNNNNNSIGDIQQNNSYIESQQQQSQFGGVSGSNTRWMIDSQFDFIHQQQQHNRNEREWNGIENIHINQQQNIVNKKINFGNNKSHDLVDNDDDDFVVDKSNWHGSTTINNHTSQITNNLMQHHHTSTLQPGDVHLQDTEFPQISTMSEDSNQMHIQHSLQHHQQQQQQHHLMQTNLINQSIMQHHNSSLFDNDVNHLQQQHQHQQHHHHHNLNTSGGSIGNIGDSVNLSGVGIDNVNNLGNISGGSSGAGSMTSNFDDDINRHVQNAIDSILNLQNSESDSLNFSLDNSMGSFLADSPLDHQQQQQQQHQQQLLQHQQNSSILQQHCLLTGNTGSSSSNININKRRSGRIDDLTDCLINGGASGDNSNMIHSPITPGGGGVSQSGLIGGGSLTTTSGVVGGASSISGGNIHGITDFSCVSAGIDDAVKSIMTS